MALSSIHKNDIVCANYRTRSQNILRKFEKEINNISFGSAENLDTLNDTEQS